MKTDIIDKYFNEIEYGQYKNEKLWKVKDNHYSRDSRAKYKCTIFKKAWDSNNNYEEIDLLEKYGENIRVPTNFSIKAKYFKFCQNLKIYIEITKHAAAEIAKNKLIAELAGIN